MASLSDHLHSSYILKDMEGKFVAAVLPAVLGTDLLRTLSRLQRTLDPLDIEGLVSLWRSVYGTLPITASDIFPDPDLSAWQAFVDSNLDDKYRQQLHYESPDIKDLHYYVMAYLLSATFKDCSLMLRFGREENDAQAIAVIDLDVKSVDRLARWEAQDLDIVRAFDGAGKCFCIDANLTTP